ncbi:MAG: hypothetical protein UV73_C0001G0198 [Candidatus Gottesmanbacteria bacterium GW2011_GWA2_43_14]|uniref:Uncharacterized protein n=1 Tax=Candidatus Gottesmanbacteria bacterium GW2011_GWA2_43_14 TaxID=1618443 RepID=A0A0G1DMA7_9BACT|nr:MAG: hypothetical protein UV73_C0001G0198 [Candidatus Gottesmanbacteria bacterium GW2011_GWA2_43_14]
MRKHHYIFHNFLLILILATGLVLFFANRGYPDRQFSLTVAISALYVVWGILYHYLKGDLHLKVVIEYILIAFLAVTILRGAFLR